VTVEGSSGSARPIRRGWGVALLVAGSLLAVSCQAARPPSARRALPPSSTRPGAASTTAPPPGTSSPAGCSNAGVIATWPVRSRAAQLVVAPVLDYSPAVVSSATADGVGGLLLLGSASPPTDLASSISDAVREPAGVPAPLVMADEEGGGVQRLAGPVSSIPWARQMAASLSPDQVEALATTVARQMRQLGVTVDLAPVLDVDGGQGPDDRDPDGQRSFSAAPAVAGTYGLAFLRGLEAGGVTPVVKHFPGLGGASGNTDDGPASTPPLATLQGDGLLPFRAAVSAGAPAVMVANASVPGLTASPASLSPAVIEGLLERSLGFSGLVMTDSLSAGAISQTVPDLGTAAATAVTAGADLVLFGSTIDAAQRALLTPTQVDATVTRVVATIADAVASGALPVSRLDDAVGAVLGAKHVDLCAGR
jgi:beta-N-acetylhexosaminidase